jgi:hypothetical protein
MQQERGYIPRAKMSSFQQYRATRSAFAGQLPPARRERAAGVRRSSSSPPLCARRPPGDAAEEVPCIQIEASKEEEEGERGASELNGRGGELDGQRVSPLKKSRGFRSSARSCSPPGPCSAPQHPGVRTCAAAPQRLDVRRAARRGGHLQLRRVGSGEWPFLGGFRRSLRRRRPGGWRRWRRRRWGSLRWSLLLLAPAVELLRGRLR